MPTLAQEAGDSGRVVQGVFGGQEGATSLVVVTEAKLVAAGRRNEPESVLVLNLARSIDGGGHSGASLAALSKEYTRALALALPAAVEVEDDGISWDVG